MTSPPSPKSPTRTYSACTSATDASQKLVGFGASGSPATTSIRRSSIAAGVPSTCCASAARFHCSPDQLHRRLPLLQTLALPLPAIRPRPKAQPPHRPRALAGSARAGSHRGVRPRPDSQRRVPSDRQRPRCAQHPLARRAARPLLQSVRGHHRPVHRCARPPGDPLDQIDEVHRVHLPKAATARLDEFVGPKSVAVPWTNVHYTA